MVRRLAWVAFAFGAGCAAQPSGRRAAGSTTVAATRPALAQGSAAPLSAAGAVVPSAAPTGSSELSPPVGGAAPLELALVRALDIPVRSIALADPSRIAVLADPPYVGDARGLHPLPLPAALRAKPGETDELQIFFGRDNEPRIMGTRRSGAAEIAIYWRHTSAGWRDGREEIGQLGGTSVGGLWGVLGAADPELVCRVNSVCIIKRSTGWTTAPAGPAPRRVELQDGTLWGLDSSGIAGIDAHGWAIAIAAPGWSEPRAFWAISGEAWVATERDLLHYRDRAWAKANAPVAEPAAFWGARADSIWVVGKGGAAHYDGHDWRTASIAGPLRVVQGRADGELWFGGDAGLFRVRP